MVRSIDWQRRGNSRLAARHGKHRVNRMLHRWLIDNHRDLRNRPIVEKD